MTEPIITTDITSLVGLNEEALLRNKKIQETVDRYNELNRIDDEFYSEFEKLEKKECVELTKKITEALPEGVFTNKYDVSTVELFFKIISQTEIKQRLIEFEFEHREFEPVKEMTMEDAVKHAYSLIKRYNIKPVLDEDWTIKTVNNKKGTKVFFKNAALNTNEICITDHLKKIVKMLEKVFPSNDINYDIYDPAKGSKVFVYDVRIKFSN